MKNGFIYYEGYEGRIHTEVIGMIFLLDNKNYLVISKPLVLLHESASVAERFSLISGVLTLIIGLVYSILFSINFTKPIYYLNSIAKEMTELKFKNKYKLNRKDEIDELGNSINLLSEELDRAITELKTSNYQLKEEIENERRLDKMRKEFVWGVSHELKTPVALIQGYAEGLKENVMEDEASKEFYCDVIVDESIKMGKLISELLNLAQMEAGNGVIEKNIIQLELVIETELQKYELLLKENGIKLLKEFEKGINVMGDMQKIGQVFRNYLTNAINHCEGEKIIEVKLYSCYDKARVEVVNTGKLIPENVLERIWESFFKVDKARSREYGGTGLGLSIVRAIMK